MIDLESARKVFLNYVQNFDKENDKIKLKIEHTLKVMEVSKRLAENLNLNSEDVQLASLIGLLHDIGRFEQVKRYNTFVDRKSVDHADLGVEILTNDSFIRQFIQDDCYDKIIKIAIHNHNKKCIESGLTDRELLHCKIIRDADKIDIFRVLLNRDFKLDDLEKIDISEDVLDDFYNCENINYEKIKNSLDKFVCHVSYIYDLNFDYSIEEILKNNNIEKLGQKVQEQNNMKIEEINKIVKFAQEYMQNRLKNKG